LDANSQVPVAAAVHESAGAGGGTSGQGHLERSQEGTLRIIAGKYRSRPLASLPGLDIRPTSDKLRETLFNVLCAGNPHALEGTTWFDLYAGTGAVGIEALSRGAALVNFVESSAKAAALIQKNLRKLGVEDGVQILRTDAAAALRRWESTETPSDFFFLDPPYRLEAEYARILSILSQSRLVTRETIIIAEHSKKFEPGSEFGELHRYRKLEQGDAALSFYRK
jgi:16S rRNA (guanine966-N2)-methyltransferase